MTFGEFIKQKRINLCIESKVVAQCLNLSPSYMVDFEKDRRNPPDEEFLNKLVEILQLSKDEMHMMFDLAGKARDNVSHDISEYVIQEDMARVALRTAKEKGLSDNFWEKVNDMAKKEGENNERDI